MQVTYYYATQAANTYKQHSRNKHEKDYIKAHEYHTQSTATDV